MAKSKVRGKQTLQPQAQKRKESKQSIPLDSSIQLLDLSSSDTATNSNDLHVVNKNYHKSQSQVNGNTTPPYPSPQHGIDPNPREALQQTVLEHQQQQDKTTTTTTMTMKKKKKPWLTIQANVRNFAGGTSPASPADGDSQVKSTTTTQKQQQQQQQEQWKRGSKSSKRVITTPSSSTSDVITREYGGKPNRIEIEKAKYITRIQDQESSEVVRYARTVLILGIICHISLFLAISSLLRWSSDDPAIISVSTVFTVINMSIGVLVFSVACFMALFKRLPKLIQTRSKEWYLTRFSAIDVCPFTGQMNADEQCNTCRTKLSYQVSDVDYEVYESDMEEDEFFSPENRTVTCPWCLLRWRFIWMMPFSLAAIVCGLVHLTIFKFVPIVFYFTWLLSGFIAVLLVFFLAGQWNFEKSVLQMLKRFVRPKAVTELGATGEGYQPIELTSSPIPNLLGSPFVNSPIAIGTPVP